MSSGLPKYLIPSQSPSLQNALNTDRNTVVSSLSRTSQKEEEKSYFPTQQTISQHSVTNNPIITTKSSVFIPKSHLKPSPSINEIAQDTDNSLRYEVDDDIAPHAQVAQTSVPTEMVSFNNFFPPIKKAINFQKAHNLHRNIYKFLNSSTLITLQSSTKETGGAALTKEIALRVIDENLSEEFKAERTNLTDKEKIEAFKDINNHRNPYFAEALGFAGITKQEHNKIMLQLKVFVDIGGDVEIFCSIKHLSHDSFLRKPIFHFMMTYYWGWGLRAISFFQILAAGVGFDIDAVDLEGKTALILAVEQNNPDLVRFLLRHGANPNLPIQIPAISYNYPINRLPLNIAVFDIMSQQSQVRNDIEIKKKIEIIKLLSDAGANPNELSEYGNQTPLLHICLLNHNRYNIQVIELLLAVKADVHTKINGSSALDLASGRTENYYLGKKEYRPNHEEIKKMMKAHAKK